MSIESVMPSNHLILCRPLLLLLSVFPSIRVFSNESALRIRWPKFWSFSFNISPFSEHPGLISFRMDWLDLLAVPGTLRSLLQHHSSKASILGAQLYFHIMIINSIMHTCIECPFFPWTLTPAPDACVRACVRPQSLESCLTLCNPLDCSPPGSSVHGILQARIRE